jgi:1,4-dihydroxy-2-naphthoate octaprenyltransferase
MTNAAPTRSPLSTWVGAFRPRTLLLAPAPVLVGATLAWLVAGKTHILAVVVATLSSVLIQIATNLFNDAKDFERGGDGPGRFGPLRAAASGQLRPHAIKRAAFGCFALAALGGCYLVSVGGWPILLLGLASLASGWAYTGGPLPISYTCFGEIFVIAFFGIGAVCGTYWLCAGALSAPPLLAGCAVGLFAAGVLMVNNFRDAAMDARVGRRTLAIVAGENRSRWLFALMMLAPFVLLVGIIRSAPPNHMALAFIALPLALVLSRRMYVEPPGPRLNSLMARTAQTEAIFSLLLCLGALL